MPGDRPEEGEPEFAAAVADIEAVIAAPPAERPELNFEDEPAPRRLAPHAAAFAANLIAEDREIGWGRFVLLYDAAGQNGWIGPFRIIAYVRTELEPEIAADPLIGQVGWSWLIDALDASEAGYDATSGTVTRVVTESFGAKAGEPVATGFELRASWSPVPGPDGELRLGRHAIAWSETLCAAAGLPPVEPGVTHLRPNRPGRAP